MSLVLLQERFRESPHHFAPFFVLGDPSPETSLELCVAATQAGASMLELGIPYDDPVADGLTIQKASRRARRAGMTTDAALDLVSRLRERVDVPLNLLLYGNLVHARGVEAFTRAAARAGASSILVPDIPLEEDAALAEACAAVGLGLAELCGPATGAARLREISRRATAFVYLTGHQGVTGARSQTTPDIGASVDRAARQVGLPLCVGFGLDRPSQVASVFENGAALAIVGSALVRRIEAAQASRRSEKQLIHQIRGEVEQFVRAATCANTLKARTESC